MLVGRMCSFYYFLTSSKYLFHNYWRNSYDILPCNYHHNDQVVLKIIPPSCIFLQHTILVVFKRKEASDLILQKNYFVD